MLASGSPMSCEVGNMVYSWRVMQPEHEADQSLPFDSKCKNAWSFTSILTCFIGVVVKLRQVCI